MNFDNRLAFYFFFLFYFIIIIFYFFLVDSSSPYRPHIFLHTLYVIYKYTLQNIDSKFIPFIIYWEKKKTKPSSSSFSLSLSLSLSIFFFFVGTDSLEDDHLWWPRYQNCLPRQE